MTSRPTQPPSSLTRREFLVGGVLGTTAVSAAGLGAAYFKYEKVQDPVRVGPVPPLMDVHLGMAPVDRDLVGVLGA